jgi:transcriptional antiterminator
MYGGDGIIRERRNMLSNRQISIIKYLTNKDDYITIQQMAIEFDVSPRTIRNDLDDIQYYLSAEPVVLERKPRVGIRLFIEEGYDIEQVLISGGYREYSQKERAFIILVILIMRKKTTIEELEKELQVSKNTVVGDIREAEKILTVHELMLDKKSYYGMRLYGNEENIRNFLFNIYIQASNDFHIDIIKHIEEYAQVNLKISYDMIHYVEQMEEIQYTDIAIRELHGMIVASLHRTKMGNHVKSSPMMRMMEDDFMYFYIQKFLHKYQKSKISEGDISYLVMLFRTTKNLSRGRIGNRGDEQRVVEICRELIREFAKKVDITIDFEDEICDKLIMHLKVAIFRLKNHIRIENPLLDEIKYSSTVMYNLTGKLLRKYENKLGIYFPDEEIAFITMYFEIIYQNYIKQKTNLKVIVVCNEGIATSTLLKQHLAIFLPQLPIYKTLRVSDLQNKIDDVQPDLIISTVTLNLPGYSVVKVNPILNSFDINKITAKISNISYQKQNQHLMWQLQKKMVKESRIEKLLIEEYCQFEVDIKNWKEAIKVAALPLLENGCIEKAYVDDMIRIVMEMGNYMVFIPEIAFVHAKPQHVLHTSMSVLNLKEKIAFGNKIQNDVKVIVVIANEEENYILADLIHILLIGDNIEKFKNATSYNDLLKLEEEEK